MDLQSAYFLNFLVALGIGLLIGAERERNQASAQAGMAIAGVRTFTIAALLGAVSVLLDFWLLLVAASSVAIFAATAYFVRKDNDPGLTTEVSLILTVLLGALAIEHPALAAGLAVGVAIILAAKEPLHAFVRGVVTRDELNDFLVLAAATLIVLPLVPNAYIGPFDALNPHHLWLIVILVMLISAFGHLALRLFGGHVGLPLAGLASGFISSVATIAAMGERAKQSPALRQAAVSGAVLSNLATILQLALLLVAISPVTLKVLALPLLLGGLASIAFGVVMTLKSYRQNNGEITRHSRSFSVKTALVLAAMIGVVLVISAALNEWFGQAGLIFASGVAGLADAHSPAISVATLVTAGKLDPSVAALPILVAFSMNSIAKFVTAVLSGDQAYWRTFLPALILQVLMVWLGWWLSLI